MKFLARMFLFGALLAAIDAVTYFALNSNLAGGVYPVDADSIGIPLVETWVLSAYGAFGLLVLAVVATVDGPYRKAAASNLWRHTFAIGLALAYLCVFAFFFLWGASWSGPHHYLIVAVCWFTALVVASVGVLDIRRLFSIHASARIGDTPTVP